jgi:homoserine dehydrogenase
MKQAKDKIHIGLLGLGNVGAGTWEILRNNAAPIAQKAGCPLQITRVLVRDASKKRPVEVPAGVLTTSFRDIVDDPDIQIIVEAMGGEHPAKEYLCAAIQAGKTVVTANKELIAKHGKEILQLAEQIGVEVYFEASVGGGIPIIRPLKRCLAANRIERVMGVINGTTNYILSQMTREGKEFDAVLQEAQSKGYAEADPSADVDGYDAAYKILILASAAFNKRVSLKDVYREGIRGIGKADIAYAKELGRVIKLLGIAEDDGNTVAVRVHPALLPEKHPLAAVDDVFNAIHVRGDAVGDVMFYGRGAGSLPTGSAVVADIIDAARNLRDHINNKLSCTCFADAVPADLSSVRSAYYLRLMAVDEAVALREITGALATAGVDVAQIIQKKTASQAAEVVLVTTAVKEGQMQSALRQISALPRIIETANIIRIVEE